MGGARSCLGPWPLPPVTALGQGLIPGFSRCGKLRLGEVQLLAQGQTVDELRWGSERSPSLWPLVSVAGWVIQSQYTAQEYNVERVGVNCLILSSCSHVERY